MSLSTVKFDYDFISSMRNKVGDDVMNYLVNNFVGTKWTLLFDTYKQQIYRMLLYFEFLPIYHFQNRCDFVRSAYLTKLFRECSKTDAMTEFLRIVAPLAEEIWQAYDYFENNPNDNEMLHHLREISPTGDEISHNLTSLCDNVGKIGKYVNWN